MITVWKYILSPVERQSLQLPEGAEILSAQVQQDNLCLWVKVNSEADCLIHRYIHIYGTGHRIDPVSRLRFISTAQMGRLVWHVFEETI